MKRIAQLAVAVAVAACCAASKPTAAPAPGLQPSSVPSGTASTYPAAISDDDVTVLNARPWKYGPYFRRLKRRIGNAWNPTDVWKALPEGRRAGFGFATRETVVEVELSAEGSLTKLAIGKSSGVAELDDEAIRAFRTAAPFGATSDGQQLKPFRFGFVFEIPTGASSMQVH